MRHECSRCDVPGCALCRTCRLGGAFIQRRQLAGGDGLYARPVRTEGSLHQVRKGVWRGQVCLVTQHQDRQPCSASQDRRGPLALVPTDAWIAIVAPGANDCWPCAQNWPPGGRGQPPPEPMTYFAKRGELMAEAVRFPMANVRYLERTLCQLVAQSRQVASRLLVRR